MGGMGKDRGGQKRMRVRWEACQEECIDRTLEVSLAPLILTARCPHDLQGWLLCCGPNEVTHPHATAPLVL